MKILVVNTGSSSLKYGLYDTERETMLAEGLIERIGEPSGAVTHRARPGGGGGRSLQRVESIKDHRRAMERAVSLLVDPGKGAVGHRAEIDAVSHRVVHGGEAFSDAVIVDATVLEAIRRCADLAPLHNPANLVGIEVARSVFREVPHVAVFDTAFHQTMPPRAYRYAVPSALYRDFGVRRYGFHGTSHAYVSAGAAAFLDRPIEELNLITLHLGNGASMAAIQSGRCVDTTMGMTPLEGLVMGTRSGDVDPALPIFLSKAVGMSIGQIDDLLNRESGLKGLCGSSDMRDVIRRKDAGEPEAALALEIYAYRIRKTIGGFHAVLGRLDALVFTAGIGEHASEIRMRAVEGLEGIGIRIDPRRNGNEGTGARAVGPVDSAVAVLVIPTNEELAMALAARRLLKPAGN